MVLDHEVLAGLPVAQQRRGRGLGGPLVLALAVVGAQHRGGELPRQVGEDAAGADRLCLLRVADGSQCGDAAALGDVDEPREGP